MRIFLTGATGFVGSHVARRLVERGHEVHALVRPDADTTRLSGLEGSTNRMVGDLASPDLAERLAELRPEVCIHPAWYAVPGKYLTSLENLRHLELSLRLVQSLVAAGCRRFVGVGTCFEYELSDAPLSETSPTRPRHLYSSAKLALQQTLPYLSASGTLSCAWARLFYLYGPFESLGRLVPNVIRGLLAGEPVPLTTGEQVRDYMHVADVASALVAVAESQLEGPVNIGTGRQTTVREIVTTLAGIIGGSDRLMFGAITPPAGDPPYICADNRRLTQETAYRAQYDLQSGLQQTVDWWRRPPGAAS